MASPLHLDWGTSPLLTLTLSPERHPPTQRERDGVDVSHLWVLVFTLVFSPTVTLCVWVWQWQ